MPGPLSEISTEMRWPCLRVDGDPAAFARRRWRCRSGSSRPGSARIRTPRRSAGRGRSAHDLDLLRAQLVRQQRERALESLLDDDRLARRLVQVRVVLDRGHEADDAGGGLLQLARQHPGGGTRRHVARPRRRARPARRPRRPARSSRPEGRPPSTPQRARAHPARRAARWPPAAPPRDSSVRAARAARWAAPGRRPRRRAPPSRPARPFPRPSQTLRGERLIAHTVVLAQRRTAHAAAAAGLFSSCASPAASSPTASSSRGGARRPLPSR